MAESSDDDSIHGAELTADPIIAKMKMFENQLMNFSHTQTDSSKKVDAMEARLDTKIDSLAETMNAMQRTLSQLSNQLGIRPIEAETSRQNPPVTRSDPYTRDESNRLPRDNRKSLLRKIEIPKFDGSNASDWLSKVERFFRGGRYSDLEKLDLVAFSLESDALKWFNWQLIRREFRSWEDFRRRLFRKFGAAPEKFSQNVAEILEERVSYTEKKGTVSTSVTESAELSSQVIGLDKSHLEELFSTGLQTEMREVLKLKESMGLENNKPAVIRMETGSFCQLFSAATSKPWGNQQIVTSKPAASVHSLSFEVGTEETMSSGLSQNRQVWEPGGVLADHVLEDNVEAGSKGLAYAGCVLLGMNCAGLGSGKEELLATGQQMQRTDLFSELTCSQHKKQMLGYKTRMFKYKSSLRITRSASRDMNQFVGFLKFQLKHKWRSKHLPISALEVYLSSVLPTVTSATSSSLLPLYVYQMRVSDIQDNDKEMVADPGLTVWRVLYLLGTLFWSTSFKKEKFGKNWWYKFKHSLWQGEWDSELLAVEVVMAATVVDVRIDDVGRSELLIEWQDHDASEYLWMFSKAFVHLYPSYKLEDKLGLEGVSIDTIHHRNIGRRSKPAHQELVVGRADVAETSKKRERLCFRVKLCRFRPLKLEELFK